MNSVMINPVNREYSDTLTYQNQVVNEQLIEFAKQYYRETLNDQKIREITSMEFEDKLWLLKQYNEELESNKPDLDLLY